MKYLGQMNLWNKDCWDLIRLPFNIFSIRRNTPDTGYKLVITVLGFTFFFDKGYRP